MSKDYPYADVKPLPAGTCPVLWVEDMGEVTEIVRSNSVLNHPDMFAAAHVDAVNGEINVREFLKGSIVFDDGPDHRERRRMLNQLVDVKNLNAIREDILVPASRKLMAERLAEPGPDGLYRMDLVEFCERVFLNFTAKLIGLVDVDSEERMARLREMAGPIAAGTSSQFLENRTEINRIALETKAKYVEEFFRPSLEAHRAMLAEVEAGTRSEDDVPRNIMHFIATQAHPNYEDENRAVVETTMMFAASVGTSIQSIVHTTEFLFDWFEKHPEDWDRRTDLNFLLNCIQETIRLRAPFSPYNTRMAAETCEIAGRSMDAGQELHVSYSVANRDTETFGDDAWEFNPHRDTPTSRKLRRYGLGFGVGSHQCFGLRVVIGHEGETGAHVRLLQSLFENGVSLDPDNPPESLKKDMSKFKFDIPRYTRYPVIMRDWKGAPA